MTRNVRWLSPLCLLVCAGVAQAQTTLGGLLDAGAVKLAPDAFKNELVQRTMVGATQTGAVVELIYTSSGAIAGSGTPPQNTLKLVQRSQVSGEWKVDDLGRICTSMRIGAEAAGVFLPPRCQWWFKLGESYFLSDSDSDRRSAVQKRTLKR